MIPSHRCYDIIKDSEGFRSDAYPDPGTGGKPWTIGYGSTMYKDGRRIQPGDKITRQQAEDLLAWEVNNKSIGVLGAIKNSKITQNQFDALVSFAYNVGLGNFNSSTLLKKVKDNPNDTSIEFEFSRWNKSNKRVLPGLTKRRKRESDLYFMP